MKAKFHCNCAVTRKEILGAANAKRKALGKVTINYMTLHFIIHDAIQSFVDNCVDPDCVDAGPNPFMPHRKMGSNHIYTGQQAQRIFNLAVQHRYRRRTKRMMPSVKRQMAAAL